MSRVCNMSSVVMYAADMSGVTVCNYVNVIFLVSYIFFLFFFTSSRTYFSMYKLADLKMPRYYLLGLDMIVLRLPLNALIEYVHVNLSWKRYRQGMKSKGVCGGGRILDATLSSLQ